MEFIRDLKELEVGDWIKIRPRDVDKRFWKIGEITHKWFEKNNPRFQLRIVQPPFPEVNFFITC